MALVECERRPQEPGGRIETQFVVRDLKRLPLRTPYVEVARYVADSIRALAGLAEARGARPTLIMDRTGVGDAVAEMVHAEADDLCTITEATFTGSNKIEGGPGMRQIQVGKQAMVVRLQVLIRAAKDRLPRPSPRGRGHAPRAHGFRGPSRR